jgi:hypothetical protein
LVVVAVASLGEVEVQILVVLVDLLVILTLEEVFVGQQDVQDDPSREDITTHIDSLILLHGNDFRGNVPGRSTAIEGVRLILTDGCKSEVHKYHLK